MAYIGPEPNPGQNREVDDISSGFNGSEVNFTLQVNSQNVSPGSSNAIIVSLGGVVQNPGTDYTVAASTLTFTTAPASGLSFFGLVLGQQVDTEGTADGSIVNASVSNSAAIAGTKISPDFGSQNIVTTGNISGAAGTFTGDVSIPDTIVHTGDTDTKIRFSSADTITTETGGATRTTVNSTGLAVVGTVSDTKGELRNVPQVAASSNIVVVASHAGKHILHSGTGGWTINTSTGFAIGDMVTFINNTGSAQSVFQGGGTTLYDVNDGATGDHSIPARGMVTAINVASNVFYLSGNIA